MFCKVAHTISHTRPHTLPGKEEDRDVTEKRLSSARCTAGCVRGGEPVQVFPFAQRDERGKKEDKEKGAEGGRAALCKFKLRRVKRDSHPDNTELVKV